VEKKKQTVAPVGRVLQRRHLAVHSKSTLLIIFDFIGSAFTNYLPLIEFSRSTSLAAETFFPVQISAASQ
jgi:hypothetical protein